MSDEMTERQRRDFLKGAIRTSREKLLDLNARNPLISTKISYRSNSFIYVIDELPDQIYNRIAAEEKIMEFAPLPSTKFDPEDEKSQQFQNAFKEAKEVDEEYKNERVMAPTDEHAALERKLKDKVRNSLGMGERVEGVRIDLDEARRHAKNNLINPSFDLPMPDEAMHDGRHTDKLIQTLLLPEMLQAKMKGLTGKSREWEQETGLNVLNAGFGFLEYQEIESSKPRLAPLLLLPIIIEKERSGGGFKFKIQGTGDKIEKNLVLDKKLSEYGIQLPNIKDGSTIEEYFQTLAKALSKNPKFKVKRRVGFGVFPSQRMAMYHDLDPDKKSFEDNKLLNIILSASSEREEAIDSPFAEEELITEHHDREYFYPVLDIDPSQYSVLKASIDEKNLAVEGPPGTGKSQTIVNMIAAAISSGKKVLFVAEKMAALEVVKNRLDAIHLGEFALPLQAKRAGRKEVIESIKERVHMRGLGKPDEYFARLKEFEKTKHELNIYCETIGKEFKSTGLTIFKILSKNIANVKFRNDYDGLFKNEKINNLRIYNKDQIEELSLQCKEIEKLYNRTQEISKYWQGQRVRNINKFSIEKIHDLVRSLSDDYKQLSTMEKNFKKIGFEKRSDDLYLLNISRILRILVKRQDEIHSNLLSNLGQKNNLEIMNNFLSDCKEFEKVNKRKDEIEKSVVVFLDSLKSSKNFLISSISEANEIISKTSRETLDLRPLNSENADVEKKLNNLIGEIEKMNILKTELDDEFYLDDFFLNSSEIQDNLSIISESGYFSLLFPKYRKAKKKYISIAKYGQFNKATAISSLKKLYKWKQLYEKNQTKIESIFNEDFPPDSGMLHRLYDLREYYKSINERISGVKNDGIRKFLKFHETSFLLEMPQISEINFDDKIDSQCTLEVFVDTFKKYYNNLEKNIKNNKGAKKLLSTQFRGIETDYSAFAKEIKIAKLLHKRFDIAVPITKIFEGNDAKDTLNSIDNIFQIKAIIDEKITSLSSSEIKTDSLLIGDNYSEISTYLYKACENIEDLETHSRYGLILDSLEEKQLDWVAPILINEEGSLSNLGKAIENLIYYFLLRNIYDDNDISKILSKYSGMQRDSLRKKLIEIDKKIIEMNQKYLRSKLKSQAQPRPGSSSGRRSSWTDMELINNEINKKQRFVSVRTLTENAGEALLELKPCWMMSPLAIAQYLPQGTVEFDLCIIDEASQMPPEEALGALVRSRQVIVVGDNNQLPPTSFFMKRFEFSEEEEDMGALVQESILERANSAFYPKRQLTWHYRSKHPDLINFSNHFMYSGNLRVAPSAISKNKERGVSLVEVDGIYSSSVNQKEIEKTVDEILKFMCRRPEESLGVVTLNLKQKEKLSEYFEAVVYQEGRMDKRIQNYINYWEKKNDGLEAFFIKNLENVQGDERDVIFISTVYGPEKEGGRVAQRFGPINQAGGDRRLNVLFSRAKHQIVTFTSMKYSDIIADENGNRGAYMLKEWLRYSKSGSLPIGKDSEREPDSDFELHVIEKIKEMGYQALPQIGASGYFVDIGVKHPEWGEDYIMGVECDGAAYHSTADARARDCLRQEILENNGWHIYRIWSTDWFNNYNTEMEKLRKALEKRLQYLQSNRVKETTSKPDFKLE